MLPVFDEPVGDSSQLADHVVSNLPRIFADTTISRQAMFKSPDLELSRRNFGRNLDLPCRVEPLDTKLEL